MLRGAKHPLACLVRARPGLWNGRRPPPRLTTELDEKTSVRMPAIHPIVMREGGDKIIAKILARVCNLLAGVGARGDGA